MRTPIGPRWLTWIILAFGVLEIPWVIYLIFFQVRTGTAYHTHLAAVGLNGGAALFAVLAGIALWRGRRSAAVLCVMAASWLSATLFFAATLSSVQIVLAAVPGVLVAVLGARHVLRDPQMKPGRWLPLLLFAVAAVLLIHLLLTFMQTSTTIPADHLRLLVVLYDSAEVVALLGLGLSLRAGRARPAIVFGSLGVVLFLLDAFVNIVAVPSGPALTAALFYAIVGEVPSIAMCAAGVSLGMRRWRTADHEPVLPTAVPRWGT